MFSLAPFGMTWTFIIIGSREAGAFRILETPLLPYSQSKKSNNVILNEVKDLIVLYINRLMNIVIQRSARNLIFKSDRYAIHCFHYFKFSFTVAFIIKLNWPGDTIKVNILKRFLYHLAIGISCLPDSLNK